MSIEVMKQALEALENPFRSAELKKTLNAAAALRQAIEQAEKQEPVAWIEHERSGTGVTHLHFNRRKPTLRDEVLNPVWTPLYTAPPRKEWVGLTDEELSKIYNDLYTQYTRDDVNIADFILIARAIEAKLKEKNT